MAQNLRIAVIGGLAAGPSAASKAKRINQDAEVVLYERSGYISYGICEIPYYLTGEYRAANDLIVYSPERLEKEKGVIVRVATEVVEIHPQEKKLTTIDHENNKRNTEHYDKLIVAVGTKLKSLDVLRGKPNNLFKIKYLEGAYALRDFIRRERPRRGVVIGAGYVGLEMSESLRRMEIDVTLIHNRRHPLTDLDGGTGEMLLEELAQNDVLFVHSSGEIEFEYNSKGSIRRVIRGESSYEADLVISAIGIEPDTELAVNAGIIVGSLSGIVTDSRQRTNIQDIYAAGDCCEIYNPVTKAASFLPLATVASKTGWTAGENAAGGSAEFRGAVRNSAVRLFSLQLSRIGISELEASEHGIDAVSETITSSSRVKGMPDAESLRITLIAERKTGRLLGATLIGKDGAALRGNTIAALILYGHTVRELSEVDMVYTPPFSPLWDPVLISANQLDNKLKEAHVREG